MSIVSRVRLDRWQDEDSPTRSWWQRLLAREEYVTQEAYYWWESDYKANPYWSFGRTVTWLRWGLGVDLEADLWTGDRREHKRTDVVDFRVTIGPLCVWVSRSRAPYRPNVHEPWGSRRVDGTYSLWGSESSPLPSGGIAGSTDEA